MDSIAKPKSKQPLPPHATKVFSGIIFDVYHWQQKLYDGSTSTFEKLQRYDTVNVFPITPNKRIVLTKQEQPGMEEFIGCAGGVIEINEDPVSAALREMKEETGYSCTSLDVWFASQPSSKIEWSIYNFIARDATKTNELNLDGGEKITPIEVSFDEFVDLCADPLYRDTEVALQILRAKHINRLGEIEQLFLGDR